MPAHYKILNRGQVTGRVVASSWKDALDVAIEKHGGGAWVEETEPTFMLVRVTGRGTLESDPVTIEGREYTGLSETEAARLCEGFNGSAGADLYSYREEV